MVVGYKKSSPRSIIESPTDIIHSLGHLRRDRVPTPLVCQLLCRKRRRQRGTTALEEKEALFDVPTLTWNKRSRSSRLDPSGVNQVVVVVRRCLSALVAVIDTNTTRSARRRHPGTTTARLALRLLLLLLRAIAIGGGTHSHIPRLLPRSSRSRRTAEASVQMRPPPPSPSRGRGGSISDRAGDRARPSNRSGLRPMISCYRRPNTCRASPDHTLPTRRRDRRSPLQRRDRIARRMRQQHEKTVGARWIFRSLPPISISLNHICKF